MDWFGNQSVVRWIHPELLAVLDGPHSCKPPTLLREEMSQHVWSFPAVTPAFIELIRSELASFEASGLEARRSARGDPGLGFFR